MSALRRSYRPASIVAISLAFLVVGILPARATAPLPDTTWGVRGKVYALAQGPSGRVYAGGKFGALLATDGQASQPAQSLAAFAPVTGRPITTWRPSITLGGFPGTVNALALSPDASVLYVGGRFDAVNGVPVHNFAAISTSTADLVPGFSLPDINVTNTILVSPSTGIFTSEGRSGGSIGICGRTSPRSFPTARSIPAGRPPRTTTFASCGSPPIGRPSSWAGTSRR